MFGIGPLELVIIALAAVIFVGPDKLPDLMKTAGKFFVQARRFSNDVRNQFQHVVDEAEATLRQEELEELRSKLQSVSPQQMIADAVGPIIPPEAGAGSNVPPAPGEPLAPGVSATPSLSSGSDLGALPQIPHAGSVLPQEHFDDPYLRGAESFEELEAQQRAQLIAEGAVATKEAPDSAPKDGTSLPPSEPSKPGES